MRRTLVALALAGCFHARAPSRVVLAAPARASARIGAVRLQLRIANEGASPQRVATDPDSLDVAVTSPAGEAVRCAPASGPDGSARLLAPGESVHLQLDLSRRCELLDPGEYRVELRHPAGMRGTVELRITRWVNPGPTGPAPPRP